MKLPHHEAAEGVEGAVVDSGCFDPRRIQAFDSQHCQMGVSHGYASFTTAAMTITPSFSRRASSLLISDHRLKRETCSMYW